MVQSRIQFVLLTATTVAFASFGFKCPGDRPSAESSGAAGGGSGGTGPSTSGAGASTGGADPSPGGGGVGGDVAPSDVCARLCDHATSCGAPDPMCAMLCDWSFGDCPEPPSAQVQSCIDSDTNCNPQELFGCMQSTIGCYDVRYRCDVLCGSLGSCNSTLDHLACMDACVAATADCEVAEHTEVQTCVDYWVLELGCMDPFTLDECITAQTTCVSAGEAASTWQ